MILNNYFVIIMAKIVVSPAYYGIIKWVGQINISVW
jgi:hypothetical protein